MKRILIYILAFLALPFYLILRKRHTASGLNEKVQVREEVVVVRRGRFGKQVLKT